MTESTKGKISIWGTVLCPNCGGHSNSPDYSSSDQTIWICDFCKKRFNAP